MKNEDKIKNAQKVVEYAKKQGFEDASLRLLDENEDAYDNLTDIAANYVADDTVDVTIDVFLADDLRFELVGDPDDEDAEPTIKYV